MMKPYALALLVSLLFTGLTVHAQNDGPVRGSDPVKSNLSDKINIRATEAVFDLNIFNTRYMNEEAYGGTFNFGVVLNDFWMTGFTFEGSGTSRINIETEVTAVNPHFQSLFFGFHNELLIAKNKLINVSIPLRVGLTGLSYQDKYITWEGQNRELISENALTYMGGFNAYINLSPHFSLGGGAMYRRYDTRGDFTHYLDRDGIQYSVNLRFSIYGEDLEE